MMITGKNYIGEQLSASGNKQLKTFNPQLYLETPWKFTEATLNEAEQAAVLADHAFRSYKEIPGKDKAAFLNAIADELLKLGNGLLEIYCLESGLPKGRAESERGRTIGQLRSFAEMLLEGSWVNATIDTAIPDRQPFPKEDIRKMLIPMGPVAVFGAGNFPLAFSTAGGDTASALAAGCPVIVKSHPLHLATGELVASAIIKAAQQTKMPNGVFSNLNGGNELGAALVKHPLIKGVGFTGSTKGGRALMDLANQRPDPIPVFAEMGSINPIVLLPQALKKSSYKWATAFAASIALGTGQFCTSPGVMIAVKGEELILFEQLLEEEFRKMNSSCMLHPAIKSAFINAKEMMKTQKGITIRFENQDNAPATSVFPTLLTVDGETFLQNKTLHQEVFGPFALIIECMNMQQLVQILQQLDGQLTATLISENEDASTCAELIPILEMKVGRMIFNGVPTGTEVCASMMHGGPYPASSDSRFTAVGVSAVQRWVRPVCYQNWPDEWLPPALKNENPLKIIRTVNLQLTATTIPSCQEKLSFA